MKTYKLSSLLVAATFVAALFCSCQKDSVTLRVRMAQFEGDSKIFMNGLNPIWNGGEQVVINDQTYTITGTGSSVNLTVPTAAIYRAVYPAEYVVSGTTDQINIPRVQIYQEDASGRQQVMAPMGAYCQDNATLQFTPLGSLLAINVTNSTNRGTLVIDTVSVKASSAALWGSAEVIDIESASRSFSISSQYQAWVNDSVVLARDNESSLNISIAQGSSKILYIFIPAISSTPSNIFTIRVFTHAQGVDIYQFNYALTQTNAYSGNIPLARMASVPFDMSSANEHIPTPHEPNSAEEGRLPGLFSVSATNQVRFSQGNLQWTSTGTHAVIGDGTKSGTWRFAEHQYDVVGSPSLNGSNSNIYAGNVSGSDNAYISSSYTGWIDLFGWGTSGYHDNTDPNNTNYAPYSTSYNTVNTSYNDYGYGPSTDMPSPNLTGASANYDWGVYNAISNGGNVPGQWRTLTYNEWYYLRYTRTDADSKYGTGRIQLANGTYVHGCIFLPDIWTLPSGCSFTAGVSFSYTDYSRNTYTLSQWSEMEAAGALFLPAAGYRSGTSVSSVGDYGLYWSSSCNGSNDAYFLYFYGGGMGTSYDNRYYGRCVRLAQDNN